jgi:hypothetical protein
MMLATSGCGLGVPLSFFLSSFLSFFFFFFALVDGSEIQTLLHQELRCAAVPEKCAACVILHSHMDHTAPESPHASSFPDRRTPKVCLFPKDKEMTGFDRYTKKPQNKTA